jgi:hypothetical protein
LKFDAPAVVIDFSIHFPLVAPPLGKTEYVRGVLVLRSPSQNVQVAQYCWDLGKFALI